MDMNDLDKSVLPTPNIKPIQPQGPPKTTDDKKLSQSVKIESSEDKEETGLSISSVEDLAIELNSYMEDLRTSLRFSLHEEIDNQVIVEIKNKETDELIRQVPPEELLQIREKMIDLAGLIFDQRV